MFARATQASGVPFRTLVVLMLAVFTVSIGYGVVLPLLPYLTERLLDPAVGLSTVSGNTGLLTSVDTLALFLFAPFWGRLSDRYGRRPILLLGLMGFAGSMLIFSLVESLPAVYAERFLSGMFAAAVTPVAAASIGDLAVTDEARARRLTMVSLAGITGFLLGPMVGVAISRVGDGLLVLNSPAGSLVIPLVATVFLALVIAVAVGLVVPGVLVGASQRTVVVRTDSSARQVFTLLGLAFIVSSGVGAFEVGPHFVANRNSR